MFHSKTATALFVLALVVAITLRVLALTQKELVSHDEAISYLAATGYEDDFERVQAGEYPAGEWVPAAEWKQFMYPTRTFSPRTIAQDMVQIGRDLAHLDIHPPLYFWLLYISVKIFGVHAWVGPLLNMLIDVVALFALARLAKLTLNTEVEVALVTFIWAASPAVVAVASEARQYSLFALCTILFVWQIIRFLRMSETSRWWHYALLAVTVAAGILTHYHFGLVLIGTVLLLSFRLARRDTGRLVACLIAIGLGGLLFLALHPYFYLSFQSLAGRQRLEVQYLSGSLQIFQRIYQAAVTFSRFLVYGTLFEFIYFVTFTSLFLWLGLVFLRNRPRLKQLAQPIMGPAVPILFYLFWLYGLSLVLYLGFLTPANGMSVRHLSFVWPFCAFFPVLLLRLLPARVGRVATPLLLAVVCLFSLVYLWQNNDDATLMAQLDDASMILVDTTHRGILPRVLWYVADDKTVLAAEQAYLIQHPDVWLDALDGRALYVSDLSYNNTESGRDQILEILSQVY